MCRTEKAKLEGESGFVLDPTVGNDSPVLLNETLIGS